MSQQIIDESLNLSELQLIIRIEYKISNLVRIQFI
jgi:hypothetical protein